MGTLKDIGNFQAGVGKVDSYISVIGAWIFAVLLVIGAIFLTYQAFVERKPDDCLDDDKSERCQHKSKNLGLLVIALLFLPLAYFYYMDKQTGRKKKYIQIKLPLNLMVHWQKLIL